MTISRQIIIIVFVLFWGTTNIGCPTGKSFPDFTIQVPINGGTFIMGLNPAYCDDGPRSICQPYASPSHEVFLSPFFIDKHEVTNGQYRHCVHKGECDSLKVEDLDAYHKNSVFLDYPVTNVTWNMAEQYCKWAGLRLPTEAEWEFIARPSGDMFPWGDTLPEAGNCDQAFLQNCTNSDKPGPGAVASAKGDISSHDRRSIHDLAGNVAEWVSDRYSNTQYCQDAKSCVKSDPNCIYKPCDSNFTCLKKISPDRDPQGPKEGSTRVYRGGSFADDRCYGAGFARRHEKPSYQSEKIGFRCAREWESGNDLGVTSDQGATDKGIVDVGADKAVLDLGPDLGPDLGLDLVESDVSVDIFSSDLTVDQTFDQPVDEPPLPPPGFILHYNGSTWSSMESGTPNSLYGIWGTGSDNIFAVGESGTIVHYDGQTWTSVNSGTVEGLYGIWGSGPSDIFGVGNSGSITHWDGQTWTPMDSDTSQKLTGVWGSGSSDVFAVGYSGVITHFDGNNWTKMNSGLEYGGGGLMYDLQAVWGSGPNDVYATYLWDIHHYNGQTWSAEHAPVSYPFGIWGNGASDIFAVGTSGSIVHHDGQTWTDMDSGNLVKFLGVWGSGPNDVFAVGKYGTIMHYDGQDWTLMNSGTTEFLNGVWGSGPSDVFVVSGP